MRFTDIFIRRPVLATVVSLLILLIGARAFLDLSVREFPEAENAVVTVQTTYTGADADLVRGFITTPLEREIAAAEGIDFLESSSSQGVSIIEANLELGYDPYRALTQITSQVNKVVEELPDEANDPTIDLSVGDSTAAMYMSFSSDTLDPNQITDYLVRVVQPQLNTVSGVETAEIIGARTFAMRVWLKPERLTALGLSAADVREVLAANNFQAAVGSTRGNMITVDLTADTDISSEKEFENLVVDRVNGSTIRLRDIADVELGAEDYTSSVYFNGEGSVFFGIQPAPEANVLEVIDGVRDIYPDIKADLPPGLESSIPYDATKYIESSIEEVIKTLLLAVAKVMVVIFLFLGSLRTVAIPSVTVPLSLIGAGFVMLVLGYSINLLTLLAMVLAIGLVVDDAIIVAENVHRHIEEGMKPFDAALVGARELAAPVVAMTITLLAVFAPIGFVGGLTGTLFAEFAFTLAGAVIISGIIALTLSPMMCSKMLKPHEEDEQGRLEAFLDRVFEGLRRRYQRNLHGALNYTPIIAVFGFAVLVSCYFLYEEAEQELAPEEDRGLLLALSDAAPNASLDQTEMFTQEITRFGEERDEVERIFQFNGVTFDGPPSQSTAITGLGLVPWGEREKTQAELKPELQQHVDNIAGLSTAVFGPSALPGAASGPPLQFVIGTTDEEEQLYEVSEEIRQQAQESGMFVFVDSDMNFDKPTVRLRVDRDKAADLGITMRDLGAQVGGMLGGADVNRFSIQGRSYKVIPQVGRLDRINPGQLSDYHIMTGTGELVPLSTVVTLDEVVEPRVLKRFQQLNAATIQAIPAPGVSLGEGLQFMEDTAAEVFPEGYQIDYAGQARQFVQESGGLVVTFFLALVIIYLVLAALFESFRDPLIILVSVPMSISGALIFAALGVVTINIYTQVGLVTLIGVISKHGILIVQFANQLQNEGYSKREAIERAAGIRLRPILMTTAALLLAVLPLMYAGGAGAASRFDMGTVIFAGLAIGTLFTIYVVPGFYLMIARDRQHDQPEDGDEAEA